jgi:hypothetical protein
MDGETVVKERTVRRSRPPSISVSMFDGAPILALSLDYADRDTPTADIASELIQLASAAPWILPQPELTTPDQDEAVEPSPHRLRSPAAALLEAHRPGPELARKLERTSLADADDATLVEIVAAWEREASWAAAQQARAIAELGRRRAAGGPRSARSTVYEVEARLSITKYAAEGRVTTAEALEEFPLVADALAAGHIDLRKANVLLLEEWLSPDERRVVHDKLLPDADIHTAPQLREMMRREALTANPTAARKRHAKAYGDRHLRVDPGPDAMSFLSGYLRADDAETVRIAVDAMAVAAKGPGDARTLDQRRADAFTDIFRTILDTGTTPAGAALPALQRRSPHIQVTVAGGTLLGLDDQPAELGGYGPIPADLARQIAQDGTWRALFTDAATGEFVALSSKAYRPGADLTRTVLARDVTCVFMGCRTPAWRCEIDHVDSYDAAKAAVVEQTATEKVDSKCHSHHDVKTVGLWDADREPTTGEVTWTAPTGHTYVRRPVRPPGPPPLRSNADGSVPEPPGSDGSVPEPPGPERPGSPEVDRDDPPPF